MTTKKDSRASNLYRSSLFRDSRTFVCPDCGISLLPKEYESHCTLQHNFNSKLGCAWCRKICWPKGKKTSHSDHLLSCFRKFIQYAHIMHMFHPRLLCLDHLYAEKDFFGHSPLPTTPVWPLDIPIFPRTFRDDHLNLAASYLRYYLQQTHDWFHIMVKVVAFDSFVRAMDADRGVSRTLLFFCWCDGGKHAEARFRQHRHSIVVSPKNHFETNVWPKVKMARSELPYRNFPCKRLKKIQSPLHLINTLGYLSHRKSRCQFNFDAKNTESERHFYLHLTLPFQFRLPLALGWDHGIYKLLYQEKFQNISVACVAEKPMIFDNGQYKQSIQYVPGLEWDLVMPVQKGLVPTHGPTEHVFHLMNGKKMYFKYDPEFETLDDEIWLLKQAERGNCFYRAVEEEMWTPRKRHQAILSYHKPLVDQKAKLETENATLKRQNRVLKEENQSNQEKILNLMGDNQQLNSTIRHLYEEENARLRCQVENLEREKADLIKQLS